VKVSVLERIQEVGGALRLKRESMTALTEEESENHFEVRAMEVMNWIPCDARRGCAAETDREFRCR
jgi:hypothetical protein